MDVIDGVSTGDVHEPGDRERSVFIAQAAAKAAAAEDWAYRHAELADRAYSIAVEAERRALRRAEARGAGARAD
ncbi:hypothetical protein [Saccharothrix syringae]|uniref:Uncharacterized protein n=1 Tax=Saccharothrix syringae TaxID=103733 RepID=A0A5Q0H028_SACSY|nr:hypothetical protein [Saccharothrix syringae]QFZ19601.1 hypothetical protein EKG83_21135 [Saccharothrix syringae]